MALALLRPGRVLRMHVKCLAHLAPAQTLTVGARLLQRRRPRSSRSEIVSRGMLWMGCPIISDVKVGCRSRSSNAAAIAATSSGWRHRSCDQSESHDDQPMAALTSGLHIAMMVRREHDVIRGCSLRGKGLKNHSKLHTPIRGSGGLDVHGALGA